MDFNLTPTKLIDQLRAWFHPKDRSLILANDCFIEGDIISKPGNPVSGRRRLYAKSGCWYDLDSTGTETGLCVSGIDPASHTHSKLVASDGNPDPALSADASGYLSSVVQPLFSAYLTNSVANVTGDATLYTAIPDTEIFDVNSNYNNATGVFTAPITGKYIFPFGIYLQQLGANHNNYQSRLVTSNRTYVPFNYLYGAGANPVTEIIMPATIIADMDSGDTAYVVAYAGGSAKTVDLGGNASLVLTYFMGYLLI